jgi:hypothetical protein
VGVNVWANEWDVDETEGRSRRIAAGEVLASPNVTEYPDTRRLAVYGRTKNQFGEELFVVHTLEEP